MFSLPIAAQLCARALANGGFTYRVADAAHPTEGYVVSVAGRERRHSVLSPHAIAEFMDDNADAFICHEACVGAWFNPDNQTWYLDVSAVVPTYTEAQRLGRINLQEAIFDLAQGKAEPVQYLTPAQRGALTSADTGAL